jgi:hypothetical protein
MAQEDGRLITDTPRPPVPASSPRRSLPRGCPRCASR